MRPEPVTGAHPPSCCGAARSPADAARGTSPEDALRSWIDGPPAPAPSEIVARLDEAHPQYRGLDGNTVLRMRRALLLALGRERLPPEALPFVLEELEAADDAYSTAVAARVLRRAGAPDVRQVEPLLSALAAMRHHDATVRLQAPGGGAEGDATSATVEVLRTLAWLGGRAREALPRLLRMRAERTDADTLGEIDRAVEAVQGPAPAGACCCGGASEDVAAAVAAERPGEDVLSVELEDQDGNRLSFRDHFTGKPSVVAFFYTRCDNPSKCPVTISRLGDLQRALRAKGLDRAVRTAAITYDPDFDVPERLEQYRRRYGAESAPDHRMLRTVGGFERVRSYFELGVSYGTTTVNRHRLEAYVLDAEARIVLAVTRRRWHEDELLARVQELLAPP